MREKHYLLVYDISDNKRRQVLVKLLMNYAYRVQFSVFEFSSTESITEKIKQQIDHIINPEEDSIILYEISSDDWDKKIIFGLDKKECDIYEKSVAFL